MPNTRGSLKFLQASAETALYTASTGGAKAALDLQGDFEEREVAIHDARDRNQLSLDAEGFQLTRHRSQVESFYDPSQRDLVYRTELEALVLGVTGAVKVIVFDHTLRSDSPEIRETRETREPASVVHNDYSERSARRRLRDLAPEDASRFERFMIINVWRPVNRPALTTPLALCDGRTIEPDDLVPTERRAKGRVGELVLARYNPNQSWFYFYGMRPDEVLVFKTFDSTTDGRTRFCIHTAFSDPKAPADAAPRESIESRCFALF